MTRWAFWSRCPLPYRQGICAQLLALPELPEQARMQHRRVALPTPRSLSQWTRLYGRKRA